MGKCDYCGRQSKFNPGQWCARLIFGGSYHPYQIKQIIHSPMAAKVFRTLCEMMPNEFIRNTQELEDVDKIALLKVGNFEKKSIYFIEHFEDEPVAAKALAKNPNLDFLGHLHFKHKNASVRAAYISTSLPGTQALLSQAIRDPSDEVFEAALENGFCGEVELLSAFNAGSLSQRRLEKIVAHDKCPVQILEKVIELKRTKHLPAIVKKPKLQEFIIKQILALTDDKELVEGLLSREGLSDNVMSAIRFKHAYLT